MIHKPGFIDTYPSNDVAKLFLSKLCKKSLSSIKKIYSITIVYAVLFFYLLLFMLLSNTFLPCITVLTIVYYYIHYFNEAALCCSAFTLGNYKYQENAIKIIIRLTKLLFKSPLIPHNSIYIFYYFHFDMGISKVIQNIVSDNK